MEAAEEFLQGDVPALVQVELLKHLQLVAGLGLDERGRHTGKG